MKGASILNNKDISSKKQSSAADNNDNNKNVTYTEDHRSNTTSKIDYNDPFNTPPGEGSAPRITSN